MQNNAIRFNTMLGSALIELYRNKCPTRIYFSSSFPSFCKADPKFMKTDKNITSYKLKIGTLELKKQSYRLEVKIL